MIVRSINGGDKLMMFFYMSPPEHHYDVGVNDTNKKVNGENEIEINLIDSDDEDDVSLIIPVMGLEC